jgi:hypothetical protein
LVGSDASVTYGSVPFVQELPAGRFRVAALAERGTYLEGVYDTAITGAVFYSEAPVARWVAGTWDSSSRQITPDEPGCYAVDAGMGALFDAGAFYRYDAYIADPVNRARVFGWMTDTEALIPVSGFGGGGAIFNLRSDGCYTTYFGLDANASVAVAMTDFSYAFRPSR